MISPKAPMDQRLRMYITRISWFTASSICTLDLMTRPVDGDTATFGDVILSYSLVLVAERSAPVFWLWGGGSSLSQLWRTRLGCHLGLGRGRLPNYGLILPLIHDPCSWINPPCVGTWTVVVLFYSFFYIGSSTSGIEKGSFSKPEQDQKNWSLSTIRK